MQSSGSNGVMTWFENGGIITAAILGAFVAVARIFKPKKNDEEENKKFIQVHSEIHETLTELRIKTDSARAQIIQFHNGEYFMDGVSMRKFSLTHESLARGMSADSTRIKGLLCSMFLPLLSYLLKNKCQLIDVCNMEHSFCKQFFEDNNVEGFCVLPITIKNQITGFLMIQWCNGMKFEYAKPIEIEELMTSARSAIEVQLSNQKKG